MRTLLNRRQTLQTLGASLASAALLSGPTRRAEAAKGDPKIEQAIEKGLRWVAKNQSSLGHWTAGGYPTAMTALMSELGAMCIDTKLASKTLA